MSAPVSSQQRFSKDRPCPACGGHPYLPTGRGVRCYGFLSADGRYAHCTRPEYANGLDQEAGSETYAHRLDGPCRCGRSHGEASFVSNGRREPQPAESKPPRVYRDYREAGASDAYDYRDHGVVLFQVWRILKASGEKTFVQTHPVDGGWLMGIAGVPRVLYRLDELRAADPAEPVLVCEGEKDADRLGSLDFVATTAPMGAGKWLPEYSESLRDRHVVVPLDNDPDGEKHGRVVAEALCGTAASVRLLRLSGLPPKGDVSDWLDAGHTPEELRQLVAALLETPATDDKSPNPPDSNRRNLTDMGNAERLVDAHGRDLRHCHAWGKWVVWDGTRWEIDESGAIVRRAKQTARAIYGEAADVDRKQAAEIAKHAYNSQSASRLNAMIDLARSEPDIPIDADALDRDPWLLNVANGILDLRTGELQQHRRSAFLSKITPVPYDSTAQCNTFLTFLERIMGGNEELIAFLQRAAGYSLTGNISERVLFILYGSGRNGKSTLLEVMRDVLGPDYTDRTPTDLLLTRRHEGIPNDIAALRGKRFVSASEVNEGRRLDEAKIKDLTGGDTISARFLRGEFFTFRPEFKLWLGTNHKPVIYGTDGGIWDRIRLIPFEVRIPEGDIDRGLSQKLREEAAGILAWMVDGCQIWQQRGLDPPAKVLTATNAYRSEMDVLGEFIADNCQLDERAVASSKDLYASYGAWCDANGEKAITKTAFGKQLTERGFIQQRTNNDRRWQGIALLGTENATMFGGVS